MPPARPLFRRISRAGGTLLPALTLALALAWSAAACSREPPSTAPTAAPATAPTTAPATAPTDDPGRAVVRVEAEACGTGVRRRATGVALRPDLVVTVAHTLDRAAHLELIDHEGRTLAAEVIWLDPGRDLALLRLSDGILDWLALGDVPDGAAVEVLSRAGDGLTTRPASVIQHVTATLDGQGRRAAVELAAAIQSGDSGSPVVAAGGEVVALVFATNRPDGRGWAIAASELSSALDRAGTTPLPLAC